MGKIALDELPGFRRRFAIAPGNGSIRTEVEDDYHHMRVTFRHDDATITDIDAEMIRIPWTTCPGAPAVLERDFAGVALAEAPTFGDKALHCTHLYDLTALAAAHAGDGAPSTYDILVSDPVNGVCGAELRIDGEAVLAWAHERFVFAAPASLAGMNLFKMGGWIKSLPSEANRENARLLRWGTILANGRAMGGKAFDKANLPRGQCFTFQPEMAERTRYIGGTVKDFSGGADGPLANNDPGDRASVRSERHPRDRTAGPAAKERNR